MASLALLVTIIFLSVILVGPISYALSLFSWMPKIVLWTMGACCIFIGAWACFIPVFLIRIFGLIDIAIGFKIISNTLKNNE